MKNNNKSIILIIPYGSVGGIERLAMTFYKHYKEMGYNVKTLKFIKQKTDIINFGEDELFLSNRDFFEMTLTQRVLFYLKLPWIIRKLIKNNEITHSIAFGDMANLFSSLTFTNEFKVGSIHSLKSRELLRSKVFGKVIKVGYKSSYKKLDKLVCISKAIKNDLIENCGYKFSNTTVIYNPHDILKIQQLSNEPITDLNELKIFKRKTIVFLGRISVEKAPWHFIKAFYLLKQNISDINLVLIGDGDMSVVKYIEDLVELYNLGDSVHFFGRKKNPYKYLKSASVLVLSSHYEGTPNVIVESIAVGTPVVTSFATKGIIELMSLDDHHESDDNIILNSGIITPNLFKNNMGIPNSNNITKEEIKLANGLSTILSSKCAHNLLEKDKNELLSKFNKNTITHQYLINLCSN